MEKAYDDYSVSQLLSVNSDKIARAITDSYFSSHPNVANLTPNEYAQAYLKIFEVSLQEIGSRSNHLYECSKKSENETKEAALSSFLK